MVDICRSTSSYLGNEDSDIWSQRARLGRKTADNLNLERWDAYSVFPRSLLTQSPWIKCTKWIPTKKESSRIMATVQGTPASSGMEDHPQ